MEEKYIEMIIENTQSVKSAHHRIDSIEIEQKERTDLIVSVKEIATEMKHMREDMASISDRLAEVEKKPTKNWDNLKWLIVTRYCNSSIELFFSKNRIIERGDK